MINPLQKILDFIEQAENLSADEKSLLFKSVKDTENELTIAAFKLDRTEKVKRTTTILLEETIEELEQKRKAVEVQNKSLEIEASVERVRTRALAMHRSEEILGVVVAMQKELIGLNITGVTAATIYLEQEDGSIRTWDFTTLNEGTFFQLRMDFTFRLEETDPDLWIRRIWNSQDRYAIIEQDEHDFPVMVAFLRRFNEDAANNIEHLISLHHITHGWHPTVQLAEGKLNVDFIVPPPPEMEIILPKMGAAFDLAYTRFMDLQMAERQVKEARLEAALERVRAKAMAMHESADLAGAVTEVFEQLAKLDIGVLRVGIGIMNREKRTGEVWVTTITGGGCSVPVTGDESFDIHPLLKGAFDAWVNQTEYSYVLKGDDMVKYYRALGDTNFHLPESQLILDSRASAYVQNYYVAMFEAGGLFAFREGLFPEADKAVIRRFANVFNLTYNRFQDILKAEAVAREALQQSSLNRIRAEVATMRTSDDLQRITPIVWKELKALGVPFNRCGVFIIDESQQVIQVYLSAPDGTPLTNLELEVNSSETVSEMVASWKKQSVFMVEWTREQFSQWVQSLVEKGRIGSESEYQAEQAPDNIKLQFIPFAQGMFYVGTGTPLSVSHIELVKLLANAFSVAYSRYEDFKKLENAKEEVEKTLYELKAAQSQLVQAEKMASLGELTAGIAHEIQNPLNFVNNFSELNQELLIELKEEVVRGNTGEIIVIANDLIENEKKINHHGHRADSIVKNMLQHSRTSNGQKEPTDINALADEYLRLAYHGYRAKDKSFNAELKTDFDRNAGKVNMVPQDIGRVLLNLLNNAFHALGATGKNKDFVPTVTVSTKNSDGKLSICIKDNGNGIPGRIVDKIFQPFFTTKPTGQGTGLGLSLSYDIVTKGHGGELKVETKEGEGTTFTIIIPANSFKNS